MNRFKINIWLVLLTFSFSSVTTAQEKTPQKFRQPSNLPKPTHTNIKYGTHERNVLDFWQAKSEKPTPVALYIHGGGFVGGDKLSLNARTLNELLTAGISVAAINYRFVQHSPLPAAHEDSVRALQFLRANSNVWNIDKTRIGGFGGSAGAQLVMYLAFHDDMADLKNADPLKRESTRLLCVAPTGGQVTMDMSWWNKHIPGFTSPTHNVKGMFGAESEEELQKKISHTAALALISKDDPPVFMSYNMSPDAPVPDNAAIARNWKVHHVNNGIELKKICDTCGVECHLMFPGAKPRYASVAQFLKSKLLAQ